MLRQLLASDAGLYVIDAREPVLAKYRDELAVLAMCGRPLLPVLNFVAVDDHREGEWREALARLGLHALVRFDSVAPPLDGERRLYESLALLLERARPQLQRLIEDHEAQRGLRQRAGARRSPNCCWMSPPAGAACRPTRPAWPVPPRPCASRYAPASRPASTPCCACTPSARKMPPPGTSRCWMGAGATTCSTPRPSSSSACAWGRHGGGAAAGAGVDLLVGGLTLGAAAALGAIAGGAWQTVGHYGERLLGKIRGQRELTVDDAILRLLALRQRQLLQALDARGHAAVDAIRVAAPDEKQWRQGKLPRPWARRGRTRNGHRSTPGRSWSRRSGRNR